MCFGKREVGSEAVRSFLAEMQPRLALHGHIHESPQVSGTWVAELGQTLLAQPGQKTERLTYMDIDLDSMEMTRRVE